MTNYVCIQSRSEHNRKFSEQRLRGSNKTFKSAVFKEMCEVHDIRRIERLRLTRKPTEW